MTMKIFATEVNRKVILFILLLILLPTFSNAQFSNDHPYTVENGIIYSPKGIPQQPRWFADNRLAFQFDERGISQVDYYYSGAGQNLPTLFLRQLWDGFRYFIEQDNKTFKPDYTSSKVWPFGVESEWNFEGAIINHRVMAVDESIIIQLVVPDKIPGNLRFKLEFFESFALTKGSSDDLRFSNGTTSRQWDDWEFSTGANTLHGSVISYPQPTKKIPNQKPFKIYCLIGADFPLEHSVSQVNHKHSLKSQSVEAGKTYNFIISFGQSKPELVDKNKLLVDSLTQIIQKQFERYNRVAENSPVLVSPYTELNNFISLAPMYHESLKILKTPGALRAKTSNYWVWGWDGMTSNYATAYWGDVEHIKNMLHFYEVTADSLEGIGHGFDFDMTPSSTSALPAQGMYVTLLQLYYANSGDINWVKERYPFAKTIFNRIALSEVAEMTPSLTSQR